MTPQKFHNALFFLIQTISIGGCSPCRGAAKICQVIFSEVAARFFVVLKFTNPLGKNALLRSQAPHSRLTEQDTSSRWTSVLQQAHTSRVTRSKRSMALASACGMALLLPTTLSTQSNAQSETHVTASNAPLAPVTAVAPLPEAKAVNPEVKAGETEVAEAKIPEVKAPEVKPAPKATIKLPAITKKMVVAPQLHLQLVVGGHTQTAQVEAPNPLSVGAALKAAGVAVGTLDRVSPEATAPARDGMTIRVQKVASTLLKRTIPVPAQLLYRPSTTIKAGTSQQIQSPRTGHIEIVERVWTLNGKVTGREFVSKRLAVAPQPRIIALGARSNVMPGNVAPHRRYASAKGYINSFRGGSPRDRMMSLVPENQSSDLSTLRPVRCLENVVTTGYSAGPAGGSISNYTATGVRCTYGAVAVDPRLIPLGTTLYIEGYGYGFACDTGGAIKGKHIDLAFDSARAAMAHGKQRSRVWILGR